MMNVENITLYILERFERSSRFYENNINLIWNGRFDPMDQTPLPKIW